MMSETFASLFTLDVLLAWIAAIFGGMFVGALPGFSATMAIALLIPVTFGMDATPALVMLATIYTTATYGGSFTAILLHTPGTPSNVATAQEGYELTKQGRGLEAIGMSTISSVFGGVFGGIALLLIAPPLAMIALKFSSPEYFFIALFGLTIIASLSSDNMLKGIASGVFGLILGLVGLELNTAYPRYTFGFMELYSGVQLIPATLGMFSISQMMIQMERFSIKGSMEKGQVVNAGAMGNKMLPTFKELIHYIPIMIRTAILGLLIGILPGAGGDIGSWVGYNEARRGSKHKELFGKGSLEAICGSETANNAVCGGSYIPLFTLGIPGSGVAAVLMGGLIIHGLQPGSQLFITQKHIIYPIMIAYLFSNIAMGIVGVLCARGFAKIAKIPMNIIIPFVSILAIMGAYAVNCSMFDVWMTLVFGFIGYFMEKSNFPTAPAILALILGPMAERGLQSSILMAKGNVITYFLSRPLSMLFFVLTLLALFAPILAKRIMKGHEDIKTESNLD